MSIDDLTTELNAPVKPSALQIGKSYLIRTVTMMYTGRLVGIRGIRAATSFRLVCIEALTAGM